MILYFDTETFSETPITNGTYAYAGDADIMIVTWAIDDGPVECVDLTEGRKSDWDLVRGLLTDADVIVAHNAMFDRNVLRLGSRPLHTPIEKWRCSMVKAFLHGLPGGLDRLCKIFNVPEEYAKKDGDALINLFCKPRPKNHKLRRATRETHPDKWVKFIEYARHDISAMRMVWNALPSWNYSDTGTGRLELDLWHRDQYINDRGVGIDLGLVAAALRATTDAQKNLRAEVMGHTDGYVTRATQRDKMLEFIMYEYGIGMNDLTTSSVTKMLAREDISPGLRELLRMRDQASQTSTSKYNAFRKGVSSNGRLCGMFQFSGASRTRRDAGRTVQLQNLPSRGLLPQELIDLGIDAMLNEAEDLIFDNVMLLTASAIRSVIIPDTGNKLCVSDLANIEGRGLAWEAGEEWKLQAFREYDAGTGPDLYNLAYAKTFQIPVGDVDKFGRSIGKVMELGLGFGGGARAFVTFALVYGIDLEVMAAKARPTIPGDVWHDAAGFVDWLTTKKKQRFPMSLEAATVCEAFKRLWREAHPMTVRLWREIEEGFKLATANPGDTFEYRNFKIRRDGGWLRIRLPSGRCLVYPQPKVDESGQCSFLGVNQFTKKWERIKTYSGKLVENITQSLARDILFDSMPKIEDAGYPIIGRVHDELITEPLDSPEFNADELSRIMATPHDWCADIPLAAKGFDCYRYRKD